jgi:hypothetical protein
MSRTGVVALAFWIPSRALGQLGVCRGFIDKDQPRQGHIEEAVSSSDPQITFCGRNCSLARRLFFIAQSKLEQQTVE